MTVKQFSEKYDIKVQTLYSWIQRNKLKEKGIRPHRMGSVHTLHVLDSDKLKQAIKDINDRKS